MKYLLAAAALLSAASVMAQDMTCADNLKIEDGQKVYMHTYFRQRYETRIEIDSAGRTVHVPLPDPMNVENLHIALSTDGRHWMALNDNKPIWNQQMRDPYVRRGHDGVWRLMATGGGRRADRKEAGPSCLYATSTDLVHWQKEDLLPLMKGVRNDEGNMVRNIWAPEWFMMRKRTITFWYGRRRSRTPGGRRAACGIAGPRTGRILLRQDLFSSRRIR